METAFSETPLALFTTCSSIGAGAFVALALSFFTKQFSADQLKRIDRLTTLPIAFVIVGFICAFFHLASPANALGVFNHIGSSPLSNELLVACVFAAVAIVYWIMGLAGRLGGIRKVFCCVVAVIALVFAAFMGLAYGISTVPTWDNVFAPVGMVGLMLVGGAALGATVVALGAGDDTISSSEGILAAVGTVVAAFGVFGQVMTAQSVSNAYVSGEALSSECMVWAVVAIVCLAISAIVLLVPGIRRNGRVAGIVSLVLAFVGVLIARFAFYALFVSAGLSVL